MFIAISGTPGTGKTAVAKILARKIKASLITTNYLIKKYRIKTALDRKRKTRIIGAEKLSIAAKKESKNHNINILESHLAHLVSADLMIILRASPVELEKRLIRKGWSSKKIHENVEAEAIGVISGEAKHAIEIDTTRKTPKQTAKLILKLLNNHHLQKRYVKKIDWSENYAKYLKTNVKN